MEFRPYLPVVPIFLVTFQKEKLSSFQMFASIGHTIRTLLWWGKNNNICTNIFASSFDKSMTCVIFLVLCVIKAASLMMTFCVHLSLYWENWWIFRQVRASQKPPQRQKTFVKKSILTSPL